MGISRHDSQCRVIQGLTVKCPHCHNSVNDCRMDSRGLCIRDPQSNGITVKRTKKEKKRDRRAGYVAGEEPERAVNLNE